MADPDIYRSPPPGDAGGPPGEWFTLEDTARRLAGYAWVERRLFEVLGAWVGTVPEVGVKMALSTHSSRHAWHAELWEERLPAPPGPGAGGLVAPADDDVAAFLEAVAEPEDPGRTVEKLVGVYRVLIPRTVAAYTYHLAHASTVSDAPTVRWLRLVIQDEVEDWREGEMLLQSLLRTDEDVRRAAHHQARLEGLVVRAGGIVGPGSVEPWATGEGPG